MSAQLFRDKQRGWIRFCFALGGVSPLITAMHAHARTYTHARRVCLFRRHRFGFYSGAFYGQGPAVSHCLTTDLIRFCDEACRAGVFVYTSRLLIRPLSAFRSRRTLTKPDRKPLGLLPPRRNCQEVGCSSPSPCIPSYETPFESVSMVQSPQPLERRPTHGPDHKPILVQHTLTPSHNRV